MIVPDTKKVRTFVLDDGEKIFYRQLPQHKFIGELAKHADFKKPEAEMMQGDALVEYVIYVLSQDDIITGWEGFVNEEDKPVAYSLDNLLSIDFEILSLLTTEITNLDKEDKKKENRQSRRKKTLKK